MPVNKHDTTNTIIYQSVNYINNNANFNLVISAEGTRTRARIDKWEKGFYYIAQKANIPIVVSYLDYKKIGIKTTLHNTENVKYVITKLNAEYPENFTLDKRY